VPPTPNSFAPRRSRRSVHTDAQNFSDEDDNDSGGDGDGDGGGGGGGGGGDDNDDNVNLDERKKRWVVQFTAQRRVVLERVPPTRLLKAMLMLCGCPFREREMLSRISGASEAIGAKKNASKVGLTCF